MNIKKEKKREDKKNQIKQFQALSSALNEPQLLL